MTEDSPKDVEAQKNADASQPVPNVWRPSLAHLVEVILGKHPAEAQSSFADADLTRWRRTIADYGVMIGGVSDESWETSVAQWMDGYWEVLIDLCTPNGARTDLVVFVRVVEDASDYKFSVDSVHVP